MMIVLFLAISPRHFHVRFCSRNQHLNLLQNGGTEGIGNGTYASLSTSNRLVRISIWYDLSSVSNRYKCSMDLLMNAGI